MKLLFSFIFFFFSFLSSQAQVLVPDNIYRYDFNQFDWQAFSDKEIIKSQIEHENEIFKLLGPNSTIKGLNFGKSDLIRLEQELELYKRGIKTGLPVDIKVADEAIALHWDNIRNIENQIKTYAGLAGGSVDVISITPMVGKVEDYYKGMWELHKGDHKVVFNMVEKKDEALYRALGSNDEAYAGFISPYVQRYMAKMGETAGAYYESLKSAYEGKVEFKSSDAYNLLNMYLNSVEIYKCFTKNFKELEGMNQQELMSSIQAWHTNQALFGVNSVIEPYKYKLEKRPGAITMKLFKFYDAPDDVKEKIGVFLRDNILNNEEFINTEDGFQLKARVDALIGLNYLGVSTPEERELYAKAIEQGIIEYHNEHSFFGNPVPLPE